MNPSPGLVSVNMAWAMLLFAASEDAQAMAGMFRGWYNIKAQGVPVER